MKKFKFLVIAFVLCVCMVVSFAGCGEDDSNPYYNGQNVVQSYELEEVITESGKQRTILHVVYDSELVNEGDRFYALAVEKYFFEQHNLKSINAVLRSETFTDAASFAYLSRGGQYYEYMDYLRLNEAFHASTDTDDWLSTMRISNIMYILIYPDDAYTVQDPNTDLLKYVGIIDLTSDNA